MSIGPTVMSVLKVPIISTELPLYAEIERKEGDNFAKISSGHESAEIMLTWLPESMSIGNDLPSISAFTVYFGPAAWLGFREQILAISLTTSHFARSRSADVGALKLIIPGFCFTFRFN